MAVETVSKASLFKTAPNYILNLQFFVSLGENLWALSGKKVNHEGRKGHEAEYYFVSCFSPILLIQPRSHKPGHRNEIKEANLTEQGQPLQRSPSDKGCPYG
jgi:hypothetical protein